MRWSPIYALLGLLISFGTTDAQVDSTQERFAKIDSDSNELLAKDEFKAYVEEKLPKFKQFEKLFKKLDSDHDGSLSIDEFRKRRPITQKLINEAAAADNPVEFADMFNEQFLSRKPLLGTEIVDLTAFDEMGNEFDFNKLRGKYTVVNFGCLT